MLRPEIEHNFTYCAPSSKQIPKYNELREKAKELALLISKLCPIGAESTLAIRKVEEAVMWANAAIARKQ